MTSRVVDGVRVPTLELVATSVATTYRFREPGQLGCWACCTVNDETGELNVQSDWGNWSYRWSANPKHLGAPTLTHFLGDMDHTDYVARKLNHEGTLEEAFSPRRTADEFKRMIVERRREDDRRYGAECHRLSAWDPRRGRSAHIPLSAATARELWTALDHLVEDLGPAAHSVAAGREAAALFFERMPNEIHDYFCDIHEHARGEMRPECVVLRESILPALFAACRLEVEKRRAAAVVGAMQAGTEIPA